MSSDTILFENGSIWQWSDSDTSCSALESKRAQWFTVHQNKFVRIGFGSPPEHVRREAAKIIDLNSKLVLPGLQDSHIHIYNSGECSTYVDLNDCSSLTHLLTRVRKHAEDFPDSNWIIGAGWEQDKMSSDGVYPTRFDLDQAVKDRPVFLWRACWHVVVTNTKAMEIAGMDLTQSTWDITDGVVDVHNGTPTGVLRESAANLVQKHMGENSDDVRLKYLKYGLQQCLQFGLTAVHTNDRNCWKLYQMLQSEGNLLLRVYLTPDLSEIGGPNIPPPGKREGLLSCDRVKLFADGSLGAETAALRTPYIGSNNTGVLMESDEDMLRKISDAEQAGYRVEVHAIGDRGAAQVLGALCAAGVKPSRRPILTHCQVLGEDLIQKMVTLGVIADIQPSFVITDTSFVRKRLEASIHPYSYSWKRLMDSGVVCAGGSDSPIETPNPFQGIYDAMFRCKPEGQGSNSDECFLPEERLSFAQALLMYTKNGAFTAMDEDQLGDIREGFTADFVVLKEDVTRDSSKLLISNLVDCVWVDGVERFTGDANLVPGSSASLQFNKSGMAGKNGRFGFCKCCGPARK